MEVRISSENLADSMLAHQDSCMSIVKQVASEMRKFRENLRRNIGVPLGCNQDTKAGGTEQSCDKIPCG